MTFTYLTSSLHTAVIQCYHQPSFLARYTAEARRHDPDDEQDCEVYWNPGEKWSDSRLSFSDLQENLETSHQKSRDKN